MTTLNVLNPDLEPLLDTLRELPFVRAAAFRSAPIPVRDRLDADVTLRLKTPTGTQEFIVEHEKSRLTYGLVDGFLARARRVPEGRWILFASYVGRDMARYLGERSVNYVDRAGNCRIRIADAYVALIEGRKPPRILPHGRGMGLPGYQVLFTILAQPLLLDSPVRTLASVAGVGKTAVANTLSQLQSQGLVAAGRRHRRLLDPKTVLERWVAAYPATARPRMLVGRYRTPDRDPGALEERVGTILDTMKVTWAWGGGAAAMRLLGTYRGAATVLHVAGHGPEVRKQIRAVPAGDGPLTILGAPGTLAFVGLVPRTVHPLLVYTELITSADPRAREVALELKGRFLDQWP